MRSPPALLQFGRDGFVGGLGSLSTVPGPAVGIRAGIGHLAEGPVNSPPFLARRRAIDGRPQQRVPEPDPYAEIHEPLRRLPRYVGIHHDPEAGDRAPYQHRVTDRFCRRDEQHLPRHG